MPRENLLWKIATELTGGDVHQLKTPEQYQADNADKPLPKDRKYFKYSKIPDLIQHFPMKKSLTPEV